MSNSDFGQNQVDSFSDNGETPPPLLPRPERPLTRSLQQRKIAVKPKSKNRLSLQFSVRRSFEAYQPRADFSSNNNNQSTSQKQELTTEDIDKLLEGLKKFVNSNKQLIAVSKSAILKANNLPKQTLESLKSQFKSCQTELGESFSNFSNDVRSCSQTKNPTEVKKLFLESANFCNPTSNLIEAMKSLTKEAENETLFKQTVTALTTSRDSLSLLLDVATKYASLIDGDNILPQLSKVADCGVKAVLFLIGSKTGKLISIGRRLELEAAARTVILALYKFVNIFSTKRRNIDILSEIKIVSATISQMIAALNETVNSNPNLLSFPNVKQSIIDYGIKLKSSFSQFMAETQQQVQKPASQEGYQAMLNSFEEMKNCVKEILTDLLCYAEFETSDLSSSNNIQLIPSKEILDRTAKAYANLEDAVCPPPPETKHALEFDLPDDLVPDIEDIWDEPEESEGRVIFGENDSIKCATLNKLIANLTSSSTTDMNFTKTFITTFRSFTTPEILLKKLIQRYHVPENHSESDLPIKLRVCNALRQWVESQFQDFNDDELLTLLNEFLDEIAQHKSYSKFATTIRSTIARNKEEESRHSTGEIINLSIESKIPLSPSTMLFVFDEEELAKQLTLVDFRIYQAIKPVELLNQAWSKPKYRYRSKNVLTLVQRSTALTNWVASVILWQETLKGRIRALTKMINVAEHLRKLNNFNSVMAVIAGINTAAIFRLKFTRNGIPAQSQEIFNVLVDMMDPLSSYVNYRQKLRQVDPPCVPFLGTYLTDIVFIEDGNLDYIKGLINYRKRELIYNVIRSIQQYQPIGYSFEFVDNIAHHLTELPVISDEIDLYNLSLLREPRNATIESII